MFDGHVVVVVGPIPRFGAIGFVEGRHRSPFYEASAAAPLPLGNLQGWDFSRSPARGCCIPPSSRCV